MENIVFTQLSISEIRKLFREELEGYFTNEKTPSTPTIHSEDEILTIQEAAKLLNVSVPTVYGYVHEKEIPYSKVKKRLYFSKKDLTDWIKSGRRKTNAEIESSANDYLKKKS